uniref:Uncharacterized protein n=1 Tax=Rhizophora mucronata TaxID=61149 RepID=A0A2P2QRW8_RHIMU
MVFGIFVPLWHGVISSVCIELCNIVY